MAKSKKAIFLESREVRELISNLQAHLTRAFLLEGSLTMEGRHAAFELGYVSKFIWTPSVCDFPLADYERWAALILEEVPKFGMTHRGSPEPPLQMSARNNQAPSAAWLMKGECTLRQCRYFKVLWLRVCRALLLTPLLKIWYDLGSAVGQLEAFADEAREGSVWYVISCATMLPTEDLKLIPELNFLVQLASGNSDKMDGWKLLTKAALSSRDLSQIDLISIRLGSKAFLVYSLAKTIRRALLAPVQHPAVPMVAEAATQSVNQESMVTEQPVKLTIRTKRKKRGRDPLLEKRDKWIYYEALNQKRRMTWQEMLDHVNGQPGWPKLKNIQGVRDAAKRYAKRNGLPPIPLRRER